jgi:D-alanyl-D-alanine carboxypeptidase
MPPRARSAQQRRRASVALGLVVVLVGCAKAAGQEPLATVGRPPQETPTGTQNADGYIPAGQSISPFDDADPAIAKLDPKLREAMQQAARAADTDGVDFRVNSGWRSAKYQQELLERAISTYGNLATARRYVSTPEKSAHVQGNAVDIGPTAADSWLSQHAGEYGLCQTYANEIWHYELSTTPGGSCPAMIADASAG